jgi:hypothetical protein
MDIELHADNGNNNLNGWGIFYGWIDLHTIDLHKLGYSLCQR